MLRLAVDLKAMTGARGPEVSQKWLRNRDFENFPLNICQCHKNRSRSPKVTVDVTPPLDLPARAGRFG